MGKNDSPNHQFADLLKEEREKNNRSAEEVYKECGISRGYQWMIENKKRGIPTIEVIMKLERGIGLKCGYLVNKAVGFLKERVWR